MKLCDSLMQLKKCNTQNQQKDETTAETYLKIENCYANQKENKRI